MHVILIIGYADGRYCPYANQYVRSFDAEAHNGRGELQTSLTKLAAKKFKTPREAFDFWKQIPKSKPLRDDGQPNKPLTAFTIEITNA